MSIQSTLSTPFQYLRALRDLIAEPRLRKHLFSTLICGIFTWVIAVVVFLFFRDNLYQLLFGTTHGFVGIMLSIIFTIVGLILTSLLSLVLMLIFGAVFLESLVVDAFAIRGRKISRVPGWRGLFGTIFRGAVASVVFLIPVLLLFFLSFVFSFLGPLAVVSFILGALGLGLSLVDLPQSVSGISLGARFRLLFSHPFEITALGACFSALLLIPLGGILFLPVAYLVAVEKLINWDLQVRKIEP